MIFEKTHFLNKKMEQLNERYGCWRCTTRNCRAKQVIYVVAKELNKE
uniref:Uncharacterized protein n=1 Tax=Meloidogyne enterolobii TaxID=390850 RepID=A0A6V7VR06_MELEN|nr:unnamed protein product [Meloidogyne enterolobii]